MRYNHGRLGYSRGHTSLQAKSFSALNCLGLRVFRVEGLGFQVQGLRFGA